MRFVHLVKRELAERKLWFLSVLCFGICYALFAAASAALQISQTALLNRLLGATWNVPTLTLFLIVLFIFMASYLLSRIQVSAGTLAGRGFELARPLTAAQLVFSKAIADLIVISTSLFVLSIPLFSFMKLEAWNRTPRFDLTNIPERQAYGNLLSSNLTRLGSGNTLDIPPTTLLLSIATATLLATFALQCIWQYFILMSAARSIQNFVDLACWFSFSWLTYAAVWHALEYDAITFYFHIFAMAIIGLNFFGLLGKLIMWKSGVLAKSAYLAYTKIMNIGLLTIGFNALFWSHLIIKPDLSKIQSFNVALPLPDDQTWYVSGAQEYVFEPSFLINALSAKSTYLTSAQPMFMPRFAAAGELLLVRTYSYNGPDLNPTPHWIPWRTSSQTQEARGTEDFHNLEMNDFSWDHDSSGRLVHFDRSDFRLMVDNYPSARLPLPSSMAPFSDPGATALQEPRLRCLKGSTFEVILVWSEQGHPKVIQKFLFDSSTERLNQLGEWSLQSQLPPDLLMDALPLLEQGATLPDISMAKRLVTLEGNSVAILQRTDRLLLFDASGKLIRDFELPPHSILGGEIRPGLLLAGFPAQIDQNRGRYRSTVDRLLGGIDRWQTWVIEVKTGAILRRINGFVPMSHPLSGKRTWLIDKNGEPFDLASTKADPKPILPFRPRLAGI